MSASTMRAYGSIFNGQMYRAYEQGFRCKSEGPVG